MKTVAFLVSMMISGVVIGQTVQGTSNTLSIQVGKVEAPTAEVEEVINLKTLGITKVPKYHALIIGVSQYQYAGPGLPSLDMPYKDAERLATLLKANYTFEPGDVTLLRNPTREEIINSFDRLAENVNEKDNVLIFYAGHGYYDKDKDFGFWLPSDAKRTTRSAWISNSTVKDYVGAIKAKHTLLITDACFGGSIFKTRSVESVIRKFAELYRDDSRKAITSGNLTEVPDKSVFLKYLLKGLEDNKDVFLPSSVLFSRIYEPITNNAASTPLQGVIQGAGDEGGDFIFIRKN